MDVLSAATETVANADAMAAAAATLSVAAASASAASTSSGVSSPRPASPATSTSTKGGGSRADGSEMDEDDARSSRSLDSSSTAAAAAAAMSAVAAAAAAATPAPSLSPAVRDEHAKLEAQAEDIRNGEQMVYDARHYACLLRVSAAIPRRFWLCLVQQFSEKLRFEARGTIVVDSHTVVTVRPEHGADRFRLKRHKCMISTAVAAVSIAVWCFSMSRCPEGHVLELEHGVLCGRTAWRFCPHLQV